MGAYVHVHITQYLVLVIRDIIQEVTVKKP